MADEFYWGEGPDHMTYGPFPTKEAAIEDAERELAGVGGCYCVGLRVDPEWPEDGGFDADDIAEHMALAIANQLFDGCSHDCMDDWPHLSKEQGEALEAEIGAVVKKHLEAAGEWPPRFYALHVVEEGKIPTTPAGGQE